MLLIATEVKHALRSESTSLPRVFMFAARFDVTFPPQFFPADRQRAENSRGINRSVKAAFLPSASPYYDQRFHAGVFVSRYLANSEIIEAVARAIANILLVGASQHFNPLYDVPPTITLSL